MPDSGVRDRVPRSIEPLVSRNTDAMEFCDATGRVNGRKSFAKMGRRPGDVGGTTLLVASGEGENAVKVRVGRDGQIRRGV